MRLWRNTLWNIMGLIVPTALALPAMGYMARILGVESFGLFMLAFALLGYASIFDGGLTRAVIRAVAINDGDAKKDRLALGTAAWTVLALSAFVSLFMYGFSGQIIGWLSVSPEIADEAVLAFELLSLVVPPTLLGMMWFSYPEGRLEFAKLNLYKAVSGSLVAVLPALALLWKPTLMGAIQGFLLARVLGVGLAFMVCYQSLGGRLFLFSWNVLRNLFEFGSWITISNIVSPLMVYADRFVLSNLLGANRVAFYSAPAEAVARMSIVPGALAKVLFPMFSANSKGSMMLATQAYKGMLLAVLIMAFPVFFFSEFILYVWLGAPYDQESTIILKIIVVGFIFNALAQIPFARIQAYGKSKWTAMIHLGELVPYLTILSVLVYQLGLIGAAIAWALRVAADFFLLEYFSRKLEESQ